MAEQLTDVDLAILRLNSMIRADPEAMRQLLAVRVGCNEDLAKHPTCQVMGENGAYSVGLIGVLNGILGVQLDGWGVIALKTDVDGTISFIRTPHWESIERS